MLLKKKYHKKIVFLRRTVIKSSNPILFHNVMLFPLMSYLKLNNNIIVGQVLIFNIGLN